MLSILAIVFFSASITKVIYEFRNNEPYKFIECKSGKEVKENISIGEIIDITHRPLPTQPPEVKEEIAEVLTEEVVQEPIEQNTTIYDVYTEEELDLLFRVVEAEVTDGDFDSKCNVASVIFNRVEIGWWNDLESTLLADEQFEVIENNRYKIVDVTNSTITACEYVFMNGDTTGGALFFDSTKGNSWAHDNCEFMFSDRVGHWFYR